MRRQSPGFAKITAVTGRWPSILSWRRDFMMRLLNPKQNRVDESAYRLICWTVGGIHDGMHDHRKQWKELLEMAQGWQRDVVDNAPKVVKRDVKDQMEEWERRFQLELTPDARESLTNRMIELADKLIKVALNNPEAFQEGEAA